MLRVSRRAGAPPAGALRTRILQLLHQQLVGLPPLLSGGQAASGRGQPHASVQVCPLVCLCAFTHGATISTFVRTISQQVCSFNGVIDRYMRNDLTRLQIRCVNAAQGCGVVCALENLHAHEDECEFAFVSCSNTGKNPLPFCNN